MLRFPPKKILVPIDLSALSYQAFAQAVVLAQRFAAKIEVVYVEPAPPLDFGLGMPIDPPSYRASLTREVRAKIGHAPRLTFRWGDPAVAILRLAATRRPDLIVMGTHGRKGLSRLALGSVAEMVVRRSPVPVLAVRSKPSRFDDVVAALNFTDYSDYGLTYAAAFAAGMGAPLTLFHATSKSEWAFRVTTELSLRLRKLPVWAARVSAARIVTKPAANAASIAALIAAQSKPGRIVAIVSHLKNTIGEAMLGTTAERVLRAAKGSVLVIPAPKPALRPASGVGRMNRLSSGAVP